MKKAGIKIIFALFFAVCLTLQLSMGILAARDAVGDLDGNGFINKDDAIHLLGNTIFSELYPVDQPCDYNKDGKIDKDDAIYLLGHTLFSDMYYICQHEDEKWGVLEVVEPTCGEQGYTIIACECGETDIVDYTPVNTELHVWEVKDDTNAATCLENGFIVMACDVCGLEETREDLAAGHEYEVSCTEDGVCFVCETVIPAKGHSFDEDETEVFEATCTEDGYNVYSCEYCDYTYTEITAPATGHTALDTAWSEPEMQAVAGKTCVYVWVETAACETCGGAMERVSDEFEHHAEYVTVTEATCSAPGAKTVTCQTCSEVLSETEIPVNAGAHAWAEGSAEGNTTTYVCSLCDTTKKTVTASSDEAMELGEADEVTVGDVTFAADASVTEQLAGESVYLSAESQDASDIDNISDELAERIGDDPIYDITIKNESMEDISNFDGWITVSVPYELADGEDPDNIVVWYIDEEGNVIEITDVEYRDGYAIFKTNHFSKYCVTRMTSAEICAKYGHNYIDTSVPATCATDGYTAERCKRCKDLQVYETFEALGHDWDVFVDIEPTCTEDGAFESTCKRCNIEYNIHKAALGHDYKPEEESGNTDRYTAPTCTTPGKHYMVCTRCADEYEEDLPCTDHDDEIIVVDPGCETPGYTKWYCRACQNAIEKGKEPPKGHIMENGWCKHCYKECEHEYYYGWCKHCKEHKKNNGNGNGNGDDNTGDSDSHKHEYNRSVLKLGCSSHEINCMLCECGDATEITYNYYSFQWNDYGEKWVGSCSECDIKIEEYSTEGERKDCKLEIIDNRVVHYGEPTIAHLKLKRYENSHDLIRSAEFVDGVESCENGVYIIDTCADCGESWRSYYIWHVDCYVEQLEDGCDDHNVTYWSCACGENQYISYNGNFNWRNENGKSIYYCNDCTVRIEEYSTQTEKGENCRFTRTYYTDVYVGEELTFHTENDEVLTSHSCDVTVALKEGSVTCTDGIIVTETCRDCDYEYSYNTRYHYTVRHNVDYGCEYHNLYYYTCACGYSSSVNYSSFMWNDVDGKRIYSCPASACDLRMEYYRVEEEKDENCYVAYADCWTIYCGEETIEIKNVSGTTRHNNTITAELMEGAESCVDGVIVTSNCLDCGGTWTDYYYGHYVITTKLTEGCEKHNVVYGVCPCGQSYRINNNNFSWKNENGRSIYYCNDCDVRIEFYSVSAEKDAYCNYTRTEYRELYVGDELIFEHNSVYDEIGHVTDTKEILDECSDVTNADDTRTIITTTEDYCKDCFASLTKYQTIMIYDSNNLLISEARKQFNYVAVSETETEAVLYYENLYEYSYLEVAGYEEPVQRTKLYSYKYWNNGNVTEWSNTEYSFDEENPCLVTRHQTTYWGRDITETYTEHEKTISDYVLSEGSKTCLDGVDRVESCVVCGVEIYRSRWSNSHIKTSIPKHVINTKDYGAACDVKILVRTCPCGQSSGTSYEGNADFENRWYSRNGREYYVYTCAVTDPVACDFVWVIETYQTTNDECYPTNYTNYYFGVDVEAETYKEKLSFENYGTSKSHSSNYTTENTAAGYIETQTCSKCGQLIQIYECARDGNITTETWLYYDNLTGEICTRKRMKVTLNVFDIATVTLSDYNEYYNDDGSIRSWEKYEYTYPNANDGDYCNYVYVYTNNSGANSTTNGTTHRSTSYSTIYSNCIEGKLITVCLLCGYKSESITNYYPGHSFYYDSEKELYVCRTCGLENANGANGDISFVNVSNEGDGTNYIINYRNWRSDNYTAALVIYSDGLEEPVLFDDIAMTDGAENRRIYISTDVILEAAAELGLEPCDYTFELAFVPADDSDTLVYSIFIDEHIYITDEDNSVFPENGCEGEGGVIIAKKCALCGDSYTEKYSSHNFRIVDRNVERTKAEDGSITIVDTSTYECYYCGAERENIYTSVGSADGRILAYESRKYGGYWEKTTYEWYEVNGYAHKYPKRYERYEYIEEYEHDFDYEADRYTSTIVRTFTGGSQETYIYKYQLSTGREMYREYRNGDSWEKYTYEWYEVDGSYNQYTKKYERADYIEEYDYDFDYEADRYTRTMVGTYTDGSKRTYIYTYQLSTGRELYYEYRNGDSWGKYTYEWYDRNGQGWYQQYTVQYECADYIEEYEHDFDYEADRYTRTKVTTYTDGRVDKEVYVGTLNGTQLSETREYADGGKYEWVRVDDEANDTYTTTGTTTYTDGSQDKHVYTYQLSTGREMYYERKYGDSWGKYTYEWYDRYGEGWYNRYTKKYECADYINEYDHDFDYGADRYTRTKVTTYTDGRVDKEVYVGTLNGTQLSETREYADGRKYEWVRVDDEANDTYTTTGTTTYTDGSQDKHVYTYQLSTGREMYYECKYGDSWGKYTYEWYDRNGQGWYQQYTVQYECADYIEEYEHDFDNDVVTITTVQTASGETTVVKQKISTGEIID